MRTGNETNRGSQDALGGRHSEGGDVGWVCVGVSVLAFGTQRHLCRFWRFSDLPRARSQVIIYLIFHHIF
jgi:hypothetical protein